MKRVLFAAALLGIPCWSAPCWAAPQQSMPGMDMQHPQPQPAPAHQQKPAAEPHTGAGPDPSPMQMPQDMTQPPRANGPATQETQSMRDSEAQQKQQAQQIPATDAPGNPGAATDASSFNRPNRSLQEQENQGMHTGSDLPAPELLTDVASRPPMALEEFLALAESSNPTLAQARAEVARSEQQGRQAALPPNPTLAYDADQIRGGSYGGGEQGAYLQQELVLGGKLGLRRDIYRQQARSNQIGVAEQQYRVRNDVAQAFYTALTKQAVVQTRQSLLKVALETVEASHRLANLGEADAPDVLQAEVEAEQAGIEFVDAQRGYLQAYAMLSAVAGAPQLEARPLKGDLDHPPQIDAEHQVAAILADSPSLHRAQQEVAIAEAKLKDARRESVPNLTLRAGEYYSGEQVEGARRAAGPESFAEAGINVPLWNRNQGNVGAATAEMERTRQEVTRTRLDLQRMAEPLAQQYLAARFTAERYRTQLLPRSQRAYELYLMKYQQMAAAYPDVLAAQRSYLQLRVNYLQALHEEWRAALALQNYTLSNGLDRPIATGEDNTLINLPTSGANQ